MIREFLATVSDASAPAAFGLWFKAVAISRWDNFADVRATFGKADQVKGRDLVVFNIGGNKYRLIARIRYKRKTLFIRAILTHAEYDKQQWLDL